MVLTISASVFLIFLALPNLQNTAFWFDEAQQILMSLGVDNLTAPGTHAIPTLSHVQRLNEHLNLDPGGFTFLLNLWSQWWGPSTFWVRLLPFLFFLLSLPVCAGIAWQWSRSVAFSWICATVPFLFPTFVHYAYEVRAYSFESLGVLTTVLLLNHLRTHPSQKSYLLLGLFLSLFMTSRYGFLFIIAGSTLCAGELLLREKISKAEKAIRLASVAVPILIMGTLIYQLSYSHQSHVWLGAANQVIGQGPPHVQDYLLKNQSWRQILTTIRLNLFTWPMIPLTLFLFGFPWFQRTLFWKNTVAPSKNFTLQTRLIYRFMLIIFLMSVSGSILGYYPWYVERRWSLYLVVLSLVCFILFLRTGFAFLESFLAEKSLLTQKRLQWSFLTLLITFNLIQFIQYRFRFQYDVTPTLEYLHQEPSLLDPKQPYSVYLDYWDLAVVRYLVEFGDLKGLRGYPKKYLTGSLQSPRVGCLRYLVGSPWTNAAFAKEVPHLALEYIRFPGSRLYRVKQPADSICKR